MKFCAIRSKFTVLLPCVGLVALGALTAAADPIERTGSDAPHQERNEAKNERKTAVALSEVNVPAFADKPVRKAKAVETTSAARGKAKDKKKAEQQQAKAKPKTETTPASVVDERPHYDYSPADDRVGGDAPHQERGSDPNKRGARLFILER